MRGHALRFRNLRVYGFLYLILRTPLCFCSGFRILKHWKKKKRIEKWKQHHGRVRISIRERYVFICVWTYPLSNDGISLEREWFFFKSLTRRKYKSIAFVTRLLDALRRHSSTVHCWLNPEDSIRQFTWNRLKSHGKHLNSEVVCNPFAISRILDWLSKPEPYIIEHALKEVCSSFILFISFQANRENFVKAEWGG